MSIKAIKNAAIAYLVRREHAKYELKQKLLPKFKDDAALIDQVLAELEADGLQSDVRYCEAFVQHRVNQGYGPCRIKAELHRHHISDELIDATITSFAIDWHEVISLRFMKHFAQIDIKNPKDKARVMRYFSARGFSFADIRAVVESTAQAHRD